MKAYLSLIGLLCPKIKQLINQPIGIYKPPILTFLFIISFVFVGLAQEIEVHSTPVAKAGTEITPLKIGDKIPDELWDIPLRVVNHPEGKETITLNDYRGKLIILDFWATWCGSCIAAMPRMEKIQNIFPNDLKILPLSYEKSSDINQFLKGKSATNLQNVSSIADYPSIIKLFFPHRLLPHHVWIDQEGTLLALSSSSEVSEENVRMAVAKKKTNIRLKEDMDRERPLFLNTNFPDHLTLEKYSIVVKGKVEGISMGARSRQQNGIVYGQALFNNSLLSIYSVLGRKVIKDFTHKSFVFELDVNDSLFIAEKLAEKYSMDFLMPQGNTDSLHYWMLDELNKATDYQAVVQSIPTRCLVLSHKNTMSRAKSAGGKLIRVLEEGKPGIELRNAPFILLVKWFNEGDKVLPIVIDETGIDFKVDITIPYGFEDFDNIKRVLDIYGLELTEQERVLEKLVIKRKEI